MERLDIDQILKTNPQIDNTQLKKRRTGESVPETMKGNPTSPYGRKRATPDGGMNWAEITHRRVR